MNLDILKDIEVEDPQKVDNIFEEIIHSYDVKKMEPQNKDNISENQILDNKNNIMNIEQENKKEHVIVRNVDFNDLQIINENSNNNTSSSTPTIIIQNCNEVLHTDSKDHMELTNKENITNPVVTQRSIEFLNPLVNKSTNKELTQNGIDVETHTTSYNNINGDGSFKLNTSLLKDLEYSKIIPKYIDVDETKGKLNNNLELSQIKSSETESNKCEESSNIHIEVIEAKAKEDDNANAVTEQCKSILVTQNDKIESKSTENVKNTNITTNSLRKNQIDIDETSNKKTVTTVPVSLLLKENSLFNNHRNLHNIHTEEKETIKNNKHIDLDMPIIHFNEVNTCKSLEYKVLNSIVKTKSTEDCIQQNPIVEKNIVQPLVKQKEQPLPNKKIGLDDFKANQINNELKSTNIININDTKNIESSENIKTNNTQEIPYLNTEKTNSRNLFNESVFKDPEKQYDKKSNQIDKLNTNNVQNKLTNDSVSNKSIETDTQKIKIKSKESRCSLKDKNAETHITSPLSYLIKTNDVSDKSDIVKSSMKETLPNSTNKGTDSNSITCNKNKLSDDLSDEIILETSKYSTVTKKRLKELDNIKLAIEPITIKDSKLTHTSPNITIEDIKKESVTAETKQNIKLAPLSFSPEVPIKNIEQIIEIKAENMKIENIATDETKTGELSKTLISKQLLNKPKDDFNSLIISTIEQVNVIEAPLHKSVSQKIAMFEVNKLLLNTIFFLLTISWVEIYFTLSIKSILLFIFVKFFNFL